MGNYQKFRGDPESKLFYLISNLVGGINTEFSDDSSPDVDFQSLINLDMDKLGSLNKRKGFGELSAISQIFNLLDETELPSMKNKTPETQHPEKENDNVVYMKLIRNDNNCFRNLSAFSGTRAYRQYQEMYGFQNNEFMLLMITVKDGISKAWLYECKLPELNPSNDEDTVTITCTKTILGVNMMHDRNLLNIDTVEFYDKIYFTDNDKGLVCFDRTTKTFSYKGTDTNNTAYKPTALEISKTGFNLLGDDPVTYISTDNISTDSIQGVYITTENGIPMIDLPSGAPFILNILYTGNNTGFTLGAKEGDNDINLTAELLPTAGAGLARYKIKFANQPTSEVEIKITKNSSTISPYYGYYTFKNIDPEAKPVEKLNVGDYYLCEMYNRAVYYKEDTIWYSEINNFDYIPNYNYLTLPLEPTDEITKISFFKNMYVVFTKQRIYKIKGDFGSSSFEISPVNLSLGCHARNTVVPIDNMLYFTSPRGLYALKNNTYVEGIENVKELDVKVKTLTSDYTLYNNDLENPAIRFNGISEKAVALRYKDRYMLFFNSSFENGDYAAKNDLDVLVYQYDSNNYTSYSFVEKPTFLFRVDDAIESFCTVYRKDLFVDEETLMSYDFDSASGNTVKDESGNGNDAKLVGNASLLKSNGVRFNGTNSYMKLATLNKDVIPTNKITFDIDLDIKNLTKTSTIFDFGTSSEQAIESTSSGTLVSGISEGFQLVMDYNEKTLVSDKLQVSYTVRLNKTNSDVNQCTGNYCLYSDSSYTKRLVDKTFSANFNGANSLVLDTGIFTVDSDSSNSYSGTWYLDGNVDWTVTVTTTTPYSYREIGSNTSGTPELNLPYKSGITWLKVGIPWAAVANTNGTTRVTVTEPYIRNTATLNNASRYLDIYVNGTALEFKVPSISSTGRHYASGSKYVDIAYDADSKSVQIYGIYYANATLGGTKYSKITSDKTNITLPKNKLVQGTTTTTTTENKHVYITLGGNNVNFDPLLYTDTNRIMLTINANMSISLSAEVNDRDSYILTTRENFISLGRHKIEISINSDNMEFYVDDPDNIYSWAIGKEIVSTNAVRDLNFIGIDRDLNNPTDMILHSFVTNFVVYNLKETSGNVIYDSNRKIANTLYNCTWLTERGLTLTGNDSYISIPSFKDDVYYTNGFKIEFSGKFENNGDTAYIINLSDNKSATSQIYVELKSGAFTFLTTTENKKTARITTNKVDYTQYHTYVIDCVDNLSGYTITLYCDGVALESNNYNYGIIDNIEKSYNTVGGGITGKLDSLKMIVYANKTPITKYRSALYEFDTTFTDFGRPIKIELVSKGLNLQYPLHLKKLKHVFVKAKGGYDYNEFMFELYGDGYLSKDPKVYNCYINDEGQVVYDYTENKELKIDERVALLGSMRLSHTKLGEGTYQTKKLVIPTKAKNFSFKIYGESSDDFSIESFGFVFKLGKVKPN